MNSLLKCGLSGLCALALAAPAVAATGDVYKVTGAKVNLREGPSEGTTALTTVKQGDELIELRRQGNWLGVRVLASGDEGWIYDDLIEQVAQSRFERSTGAVSFKDLSEDFARLIERINTHLSYPLAVRLEQREGDTLRVAASREWLLHTNTDVHLLAALALYEVWKDNQNNRPVKLVLNDDRNEEYIVISDTSKGPQVTVRSPAKGDQP